MVTVFSIRVSAYTQIAADFADHQWAWVRPRPGWAVVSLVFVLAALAEVAAINRFSRLAFSCGMCT